MESRLLNSGQTPPKVSTQIQPYASPPRRLMAQSVEGVEGIHPDSLTWHSNQGPRAQAVQPYLSQSPLCASTRERDNTRNPHRNANMGI